MKSLCSLFVAGAFLVCINTVSAQEKTPEPTATATPKPTATVTPKPTATVKPKPTGLARVCRKIKKLSYHQLYKFQASGHLAGTERARSCSFICGPGAGAPASNYLPIYDAKGRKLSTFRNYARNGFYKARFYTYRPSCYEIATRAKRANRGKAVGYIGVGKKQCIKIKNLFGREGAAY